ncbi:YheC/YheD family protein [Desmospora activa]|uniref:YheC/D-like protein n=1 Tax=Desmospora activa DSM 45169 TaxID=1121389 RepID=A0A2T4Z850_9BACL|nr:YheC/YheD family protein [Desmospora activa]PTM58050.1 YheC/D-like protein [Desmospora activa DSM 45169]
MSEGKAGWLAIRSDGRGGAFIPHPRWWKGKTPSKLPVFWKNQPLRVLPIQTSLPEKGSPYHLPTRLLQSASGFFRAGPFIAILTSAGGKGFRGNSYNFRDIIQTGRRLGVTVYVLTPEGIQGNQSQVNGFLLDSRSGSTQWVRATLPLPDIVYNRIPSRTKEQLPAEQKAIHFFNEHPDIHLFNPGFFNKWTLYTYLQQSDNLKNMLPATQTLESPTEFYQLTTRYDTLILKPINGKAGKDMIRIQRRGAKFVVTHQRKNPPVTYVCENWNDVLKRTNRLTYSQKYVIQQGITLARYQGRPFDLRLLAQKNVKGEWGCTGIGIRVAGGRAISTHVPMGGSIADVDVVLNEVFKERATELKEKVERTGIVIARHIESEEGKNLGEMSMDLGLDEKGQLWFFEANAKPMKFDEPEIRRRSLENLIYYALHLSGHNQPKQMGG